MEITLQDLQGPKIRVGEIPNNGMTLTEGSSLTIVPLEPRFRTSKCSIKKYIVLKSPKIIPGQEYFSFH
ncbi:hypothetical protein WH8501_17870 [Crocosphaera watsonii WH 8501]|uniref:hypothetical protein n=1 Tax=Crocosphaera watsonii TaxID=263511 RepID=UPI000039BDB4